MKNINIPLSDDQWRTLKELAHLRKMAGAKPDSVTQLVLAALSCEMHSYRLGLAALRGARKGKA